MPLRNPISAVLDQHVEDAAVLYNSRAWLLSAPNCRLHHLRRSDDRLAAHLDGIAIGGDIAWTACESALEWLSSASLFVAAVTAIEGKRLHHLYRLFALAQSAQDSQRGLRAAFGWADAPALRDIVVSMLDASEPAVRATAIAASSMHRVDPALGSARRLEEPDPLVRARAFRTAGELGKAEFVSTLAAALADDDPQCQFWAAWSAVLLGDRERALDFLTTIATEGSPFQRASLSPCVARDAHEKGPRFP